MIWDLILSPRNFYQNDNKENWDTKIFQFYYSQKKFVSVVR